MKALAGVLLAIVVSWLALAAGLLVAFPVQAVQIMGNALILDAEDLMMCREEGGCLLITTRKFESLQASPCERKKDET